jgi:hypothetical protein
MTDKCTEPVTHIDDKGYIYCSHHGLYRRFYRRCRKLRPHEMRRLQRGELVKHY